MDNLLQTIKALYLQISDRDLLRLVMCQRDSRNVFMPIDGVLTRMLQNNLPSYTIDQIENVKAFSRGSWMKGSDDSLESLMYSPKQTPLNVLLSFASKALHVNQGKPICQYDGLMRWHTITSVISEDTVTTAFLASYDLKKNIDRVNFDWEPVISHDNKDVNSITSREVTELHNHLFGSSLSVELNWLSVMNNNVNNPQKYKYFSTNLRQQSLASDYSGETDLYTRIVKAAAIRLYLFCKTNKIVDSIDTEITDYIQLSNIDQSRVKAQRLYQKLFGIKKKYGKLFTYSNEKHCVADYAVPLGVADTDYAILTGERKLLYDAFRMVLADKTDSFTMWMLYTYLVLKNKFRNELIQTNDYTGFANFQLYQNRKVAFIKDNSVYEHLLVQLAIRAFTAGDKNSNHYLETRITPKSTPLQNYKTLVKLVKSSGNEGGTNYDFVLHFIKGRDKTKGKSLALKCRHHDLREKVKMQAISIAHLWKVKDQTIRSSEGGNRYLNHIAGIDAASSEINCRPEVFAQAYRYLRTATADVPSAKPFGFTYHVGEDYLDVVDGLRAVDEAIRFLKLKDGDRIGHGLVLGVDVEHYYSRRFMTVTTTAQVWLDNVVWLYIMCSKYNIGSCLRKLKEWYDKYYLLIYSNDKEKADIDTYYRSMLLRGDAPALYSPYSALQHNVRRPDNWGMSALCQDDDVKVSRNDKDACTLYYRYHFDEQVKMKGAESIEVKITSDFIDSVKAIQEVMLDRIAQHHIAIECNPTSNYRIGDFDRYIEHPIFKFFNKDIKVPHKDRCLKVSINTDDKGVFSTSLEREYALLAWALEKEGYKNPQFKNSQYDIALWLDRIRQMGIEQKFA